MFHSKILRFTVSAMLCEFHIGENVAMLLANGAVPCNPSENTPAMCYTHKKDRRREEINGVSKQKAIG